MFLFFYCDSIKTYKRKEKMKDYKEQFKEEEKIRYELETATYEQILKSFVMEAQEEPTYEIKGLDAF